MADVFISYAREDRKAVEKLDALLEAEGFSCWFDEQLSAGERFAERTAKELAAAKAVIVVWTKHSVNSHWVADEAGEARDTGRLAPMTLDGSAPPLGFRQFQCVDFSAWSGKRDAAFEALLAALRILLAKEAEPPAPPRRVLTTTAPRIVLIGVAALLAATTAGFVLMNRTAAPRADEPRRVAIFSLNADAGDADLTALASGVADDVAATLTASGISVAARNETSITERGAQRESAQRLGADLAVEGSTERAGETVSVTTSIFSPAGGVVLWSQTLSESASDARLLRLRAATSTADAVYCGLEILKSKERVASDDESIGLFLRSCTMTSTDSGKALEARDLLAQLVKREPDFAYGQASFAIANAYASMEAPGAIGEQLRADAVRAVAVARRLDPDLAEVYIAEEVLADRSQFRAREERLREGLSKNELNSSLNAYYSDFLDQVGRVQESASYAKRASALDPLSTHKGANLADFTFKAGDAAAAGRQIDQLALAWPNDTNIAVTQLRITFWSGRYDAAMALIEQPASDIRDEESRACWRRSADALQSLSPADRLDGTKRVRECNANKRLPEFQTLLLLSALGDLDAAFAHARKLFIDQERQGFAALFYPATAPMRADPRFLPLADEIGLLDYWRESGHWPDFCESALYDCAAEAERLTGR